MTSSIAQARRWDRRQLLQAGCVPLLGLTLPQLLAAEQSKASEQSREKSCIFIFQYGGLSQLDSWDPKPDAPAEVRGPYCAIPTTLPGFRVGELMPRLARLSHRYAVLRSLSHGVPVHDLANRMLLAGQSQPALNVRAICCPIPRFGRLSRLSANHPPSAIVMADTHWARTCCWRGD